MGGCACSTGELVDVELPPIVERHNAIARALVRGELR